MKKLFLLVVVTLLAALSGCGMPRAISERLQNAPLAPAPSLTPTLPPTPMPTPEAQPSITPTNAILYQQCGWQWASVALEEPSAQAQALLDASGLAGTARLAAYGENCLDNNKVVQYFAAMQTDFYFDFQVKDVTDRAALGQTAEVVLGIVARLAAGSLPGAQPGLVNIAFTQGSQVTRMGFPRQQGADALAQGLKGAALYEALLKK